MDYKNLSDSELASIMVNYINRVEHLQEMIAGYIDSFNNGSIQQDRIKDEYRRLKYELRENTEYLDLIRNQKGSQLYMGYFSPSIREASAWGFTVPINHRVDQQMFSAVADAHYKLTKYYSLEQWGALM